MATTYFPNSEQFDLMNAKLDKIAGAIAVTGQYADFAGMQRAVRNGLGREQFPIGSQFIVPHSTFGDMVCEVMAHDYLKSAYDQNAHTMTCKVKTLLPAIQFDEKEAFYYADDAIPAGTYHFSIGTAYSSWAAGSYQFTLANALPKGGQLCFNVNTADAALTSAKVQAYASQTSTTVTETCDITSGNGGTNLGELGNGLNHPQRICYGSNNYKESAMRQHLNSPAAAGSVWKPQTKFDRPPSWLTTLAGFEAGLDADFLAVVGAVALPCTANTVYESPDSTVQVNTAYTVKDKFYLLSRNEVFGSKPFAADESVLLPYYEGATNADRIGYTSAGTPAYQWLRTPLPSNATNVTLVHSDGSLLSNYARVSLAYAPAFTII